MLSRARAAAVGFSSSLLFCFSALAQGIVVTPDGRVVIPTPPAYSVPVPLPLAPPPLPNAYYVATTGNDSNPGTLAAPFLTIAHCQTVMQSSTTKICYIRSGVYAPSSAITLTGSDGGETISVYPPDGVQSAEISGVNLPPSTVSVVFNTASNSSITFSGFKLTHNGYVLMQLWGGSNNLVIANNLIDGGQVSSLIAAVITSGTGTINNLLFYNNTVQNAGLTSSDNQAGLYTNVSIVNSLVASNLFRCNVGFGIFGAAAYSGDVFWNNTVTQTGQSGGAPTCPNAVNPAGTGVEITGSALNLFIGHADGTATIVGSQGYGINCNGTTGSSTTPCIVSDSLLHNNGDPTVLFNSASNSVLRRSTMTSPGSIGVNAGEEHDTCPRSGYSNGVLILNNTFTGVSLEQVYVTVGQSDIIQGNVGGIGTTAIGNPSPHYAAGVTFPNWAVDAGCSVIENSTNNTVQLNQFTSTASSALYGVVFEANQAPNTVQWNVFYPLGTANPTTAVLNNSGGTITVANNQTTSVQVSNSPPIADAGAAQVVASGQAGVVLNGSNTRNLYGGAPTGTTYSWTQVFGSPTVTLSNSSAISPNFAAPTVTQCAILGFKLTVSNANGSTYDQTYVGVCPKLSA